MIRLENVSKSYKIDEETTFFALKDATLEIKEKEFISIIGPSGSGKSTLMHLIGLLDKPSRGEIIIQNKKISRLDDDQISTLRNEFVGFVFQQFNLIPKLTVLENILLPTVYARKKIDYDPTDKAIDLLKKFGLYEKRNSYPNKISGGQQQRVAILFAYEAISTSWVTTAIVSFSFSFNNFKSSIIPFPVLLSKLPVGSSAKINFGSIIKARRIATLCCCPPDILLG